MTAVGRARVPMPAGQPTINDYVLEEVIWCARCARHRHPAPAVDGTRSYACEPGCPQPPTEALPVEQHALLAAYVRAATVLHGVGRVSPVIAFTAEPEHWRNDGELGVSARELARWRACNLSSRQAVIQTAFVRVEIDANGRLHLIWQHAEAT